MSGDTKDRRDKDIILKNFAKNTEERSVTCLITSHEGHAPHAHLNMNRSAHAVSKLSWQRLGVYVCA